MKQSKYNIIVKLPNSNDSIVYNTLYKGMIRLEENYVTMLEQNNYNNNIEKSNTKDIIKELRNQKFIIDDEDDEFEFLKYEFYKTMFDHSQLVLTIAPTLACNFSCPYCYETSRNEVIDDIGIQSIYDFVREKYEIDQFKKIKINWYGGEPLLSIPQIISISNLLIEFSNKNKIEYTARMVTNGSKITMEVIEELKQIKISDIQITIDGLKENHDKRRISKDGKSTYELLIKNVKLLVNNGITVGIRMNTDEINKNDYLKLAKIFENEDKVYVYMGHLRKYKEDFGGHKFNFFSKEQFSELEYETFCKAKHSIEDLESILGCKKIFCTATIDNNFVIDEKCNVYKCWNDIGNDKKIIFNLTDSKENRAFNKNAFMEYMSWNPFKNKQCQECKVFPICSGGCVFESNKDNETFCYPPKYCIDKYILKYYNDLKVKNG